MKKHEQALLLSYMVNNRIRLEDTVKQYQSNIRFRKIDLTDCFELIVAQVQLETFNEMTKHIRLLLNLSENHDDDT